MFGFGFGALSNEDKEKLLSKTPFIVSQQSQYTPRLDPETIKPGPMTWIDAQLTASRLYANIPMPKIYSQGQTAQQTMADAQKMYNFWSGTQWTEEQLNQMRKLAQTKNLEHAADPDGPLTPLPAPPPKPPIAAQKHDFIAALYRPYESPI